jgi:hypothetical protein
MRKILSPVSKEHNPWVTIGRGVSQEVLDNHVGRTVEYYPAPLAAAAIVHSRFYTAVACP